jgi:hypothetical protein
MMRVVVVVSVALFLTCLRAIDVTGQMSNSMHSSIFQYVPNAALYRKLSASQVHRDVELLFCSVASDVERCKLLHS